ncbi:TPA: hypothetical protein ACVO1C_003143 [Vibrio diabolicus]
MKQNATATAKGFIYQFYEAIDWCWKLKQGQKLFIETFGDISVSGDANVEVKNVKGTLTDMGECFWKTLGNWLDDKFNESDYNTLILLTTQVLSPTSSLSKWNDSNLEERLDILNGIISNDYNNHIKKLEEYKLKKEIDERLKEPKLNKHVDKIRKKLGSKKLSKVVGKLVIMDSSPLFEPRYNEICDIYGKSVLKRNVESFINAQIGYIVSPAATGKNWEITYDDFASEVRHLTQIYASGSRVFPSPKRNPISVASNQNHIFVDKIHDIDYSSEIDAACTDYTNSLSIINDSFSSGELKNRYEDYLYEVSSNFDRLYKRAARRCTSEVELDSQDFYDECHLFEPPVFSGYEETQKSFRNGVLHIQMNDKSLDKKWRLK